MPPRVVTNRIAFYLAFALCLVVFLTGCGLLHRQAEERPAEPEKPLEVPSANKGQPAPDVTDDDDKGPDDFLPILATEPPAPRGIPVLMYHMFTYDSSLWNYMIISPHKFKADLVALRKAGFKTVHPHEIVAHMEGRGTLPDKPILITVDDGYLDNYTLAYPILQELDMKATFFVIGAKTSHNDPSGLQYFTWEQAREMYESGLVSIQPHSYDLHNEGNASQQIGKGVSKHGFETPKEHEQRFRDDTLKVMALIKEKTGDTAFAYSYPYGIYNEVTERILAELGIKLTVTVEPGVGATEQGLYLMPRINVPHGLSTGQLLAMLH